jgi:predicted  nucleic acid-binding Zn-ribbon protein
MPLKEDLALLYELQRIDSQLERLEKELTTLDDGARAARRAQEHEAALQTASEQLRQAEGGLKDRELALESAEAERKQKWQRAYGGTVGDIKELSALERKIEELDRRKGRLEEEILALYDTVERLRAERNQAEQRATEGAARAKRARAHFVHRTKEIHQEQAALTQRRGELAARAPAALYQQYEKMRAAQEGVAIAGVVEGACEFCRTRVPSEYEAELRRGLRIIHCESCGRILALGGIDER